MTAPAFAGSESRPLALAGLPERAYRGLIPPPDFA